MAAFRRKHWFSKPESAINEPAAADITSPLCLQHTHGETAFLPPACCKAGLLEKGPLRRSLSPADARAAGALEGSPAVSTWRFVFPSPVRRARARGERCSRRVLRGINCGRSRHPGELNKEFIRYKLLNVQNDFLR